MEKFTKWLNSELPAIVKQLENTVQSNNGDHTEDGLDFTGRNDIFEILDDILSVFFPRSFSKHKVTSDEMNFYLSDRLRHISFRLGKHIRDAFTYRCKKENCNDCTCDERGRQALMTLVESIPAIRATLFQDVQAAFDGDPAAQFYDEIIMSYPCVEAIATYRVAHKLYELDVPLIPRIMSERAHSHTGIDIHPGASIDSGFFIDHGTGVVIGETTRIGRNVKLYQGVTLGALSPFDSQGNPRRGEKRHPNIEDDVIIYANATILGGDTVIGKGAVIGGNTWIIKSVPPGEHVYNKPRENKAT
jgi:serine O-acetyltransferase